MDGRRSTDNRPVLTVSFILYHMQTLDSSVLLASNWLLSSAIT